ncbi:CBU_0592 family membrane protein [Pseudemcibacter sp.]|jgi:glucose uptake protein GlcU|uniref:CBU_0592 family membrane protein n=1 Tax=Pseudemcibacter sp. TaxID=2943293 RepID=UPI003F69DBE0
MNTFLFDAIGMLGVFMILAVYSLVQLDKMDVKGLFYSIINAVGAVFILISLTVTFNMASFVIECAWLVISLFGIFQALKRTRSNG